MDEKLKIFYELYEKRRSIREFSDRDIEKDKLERLYEILRRSQSAANRQPWHFIIIEKEDTNKLENIFTKEGFKTAPIIIAACAEPDKAWVRKTDGMNYAWVDIAIAITDMIGAATAEGLGTCWVAAIEPLNVKKILNIPQHIDIVALIAMGYPKTPLLKEDKNRKSAKEVFHYGGW